MDKPSKLMFVLLLGALMYGTASARILEDDSSLKSSFQDEKNIFGGGGAGLGGGIFGWGGGVIGGGAGGGLIPGTFEHIYTQSHLLHFANPKIGSRIHQSHNSQIVLYV
ncbi:hypothetical protein POM88_010916 [Heracleum sosnowskyi]|uniref:Glycine-rich protein n=1 Tax=Heracleum sosnowskyi TaxID=360622 RepID=A0AAD8MW48_9APIA|nr:hypothetical protein POM88_010916 [Heracleum sosnowskyi]